MENGRLLQIQIGLPKKYGSMDATNPFDRPWESGIYKDKIDGAVWVSKMNVIGDGQADTINHGGVDKAVFAFAAEHYPYFKKKLQKEFLPYGAFGENLTVENQSEKTICIGDTVEIGEVILQVSQPRKPCWKLARRWQVKDLALQLQQTGFTGWYYRVLQEGSIKSGQPIKLLERPCPKWTLQRCNVVMHMEKDNDEASQELANCKYLAKNWTDTLHDRVTTKEMPINSYKRLYGSNG
jgi:MOSC domain-containing protein YiiM